MRQSTEGRGPYRAAIVTPHARAFEGLVSAELQLLNAAGAARVAARRIGDQGGDVKDLQDGILLAVRRLEEAASRVRERRQALLIEWKAAAGETHDRVTAL